MQLNINDRSLVESPSRDVLRDALQSLNGEEFAVLLRDDQHFVQAYRDLSEGWVLEYRDGSADRQFAADPMETTLKTICDAFAAFHNGSNLARLLEWQQVELVSSPPRGHAPIASGGAQREFVEQTISGRIGVTESVEISDLRFVNCEFHSYAIASVDNPADRTVIRNVELIDCTEMAGRFGPAFLCDISIVNLNTTDLFILSGPRFQHVTIEGKCGRVKVNANAAMLGSAELNQEFARQRDEFYMTVDWALDISKARFRYAEFHGVPGDLVRRDPETQICIRRASIDKVPDWRDQLNDHTFEVGVDFFLRSECQSTVMVAPMLASKKQRERDLKCFETLRRLGIADSD